MKATWKRCPSIFLDDKLAVKRRCRLRDGHPLLRHLHWSKVGHLSIRVAWDQLGRKSESPNLAQFSAALKRSGVMERLVEQYHKSPAWLLIGRPPP